MRVIAGKAKGYKLHMVPGDTTRPVMDIVKESAFNIIAPYIFDAAFLDLYAGTGSVGIEALSRGARMARFVDVNPKAVKTIQNNLEHTGLADGAEVWHKDVFSLLKMVPDRRFDFVYIAPPQYKGLWLRTLEVLDKNLDWLEEDAWVIVQIDPVEEETLELENLELFDRRVYGSTELLFFYPNAQDQASLAGEDEGLGLTGD